MIVKMIQMEFQISVENYGKPKLACLFFIFLWLNCKAKEEVNGIQSV